jgi:Skp family chaperone for outer membrane proteins
MIGLIRVQKNTLNVLNQEVREKEEEAGVVRITMALKNEKVPVPKQVQKRYKQEFNRYKKQIQKLEKIQAGKKAA